MEDGKAGRRSELLTSRSVLSELDPATMSPAHQKQRSLPNVEEEAESVPPLDLDTKVTSFPPLHASRTSSSLQQPLKLAS